MVSLEEAWEFLISHQGASVSSIKCSKGISLTTFKLSSVFKELGREFMLSFWQSQLLFRTEFLRSILSLLQNYDWKLEVGSIDTVNWLNSWLFFKFSGQNSGRKLSRRQQTNQTSSQKSSQLCIIAAAVCFLSEFI